MDQRKLQTLLAVTDAGSLNAAAERLNCTQSAVTQMVNAIEGELGFPVFRRSNRGVRLTDEGKAVMPYVVSAYEGLAELADEAAKIAEGRKTPLRIGTFYSISVTLLPEVIAAFRKTHPEVAFDILVGSEELPDWLESGKIHLLIADEKRKAGKYWYPVLEDPIYAAAPASYGLGDQPSIGLEKLADYPLIVNPFDMFSPETERLAARPGTIRVLTDDSLSPLRMAARELGITLLPELSLRAVTIPDNIDLLELDPPLARTIGVCLPAGPHRMAREFSSFLQAHDF